MVESTHRSTALADDLFDKYLLPKVALTVILVASLAGTALSVRLTGAWSVGVVAAKWAYLVALGVLAGGLLWQHGFVRPTDLDAADDYLARMYGRFDRIATGALAALVLGGAVALRQYVRAGVDALAVAALGGVLAALTTAVAVEIARDAPVADRFRNPLGVAALALAVAAVAATATAEVALRAGDPTAVGVRVLHLLAFAAWVGGAVWNIFVAVPTGQSTPTIPVVRAAGQQLERFRWAVRFVIPTLVVTGAYQAVDALGTTAAVYLHSGVGLAVLAKLGLVGVLVVIFKLCPMWRACSPVDGVCDLADLDDDRPADPTPTDD